MDLEEMTRLFAFGVVSGLVNAPFLTAAMFLVDPQEADNYLFNGLVTLGQGLAVTAAMMLLVEAVGKDFRRLRLLVDAGLALIAVRWGYHLTASETARAAAYWVLPAWGLRLLVLPR